MRRNVTGRVATVARGICLGLWAFLFCLSSVQAQSVPPHLVGFTRSLLGQIDQKDLDALPEGARTKLRELIGSSRIRSWAGQPLRAPMDVAELGKPLGLDTAKEEHRPYLSAILGARNATERRSAIAAALAAAGRDNEGKALDDAVGGFNQAQAEQLKDVQRHYEIDAGDKGEKLIIDWDPDTASFVTRAQFADGDEVVFTGAARARPGDSGLQVRVERDEQAVTYLSQEDAARLRNDIFGVWKNGDETWFIRRPDGDRVDGAREPSAEDRALADIARLEQRIAALEAERNYVWIDPRTNGQVIQKQFRRLPDPYVYRRDLSENFNKEEIDRLKAQVSDLRGKVKLPPVRQHDPTGAGSTERAARNPVAIEIEVWRPSGRIFRYDEATFDGYSIKANRTLRVMEDISNLPEDVIRQLITSWSPPEWIDLAVNVNPREKKTTLEGLWWRLHVTRDGMTNQVKSIHTPYNRALKLIREPSDVAIKVVDLDGKSVQSLGEEDPFKLIVKFAKPPENFTSVIARWATGAQRIFVTPVISDGLPDELTHESGVHYLRSDAYRDGEPRGLLDDSRFFEDFQLKAEQEEWRRENEKTANAAARLFKGKWNVAYRLTDVADAPAQIGLAEVAEDGRSVRLALKEGETIRRYHSLEMQVVDDDTGGIDNFLTVRFEEGPPPAGERTPFLKPLLKGRFVYVPDAAADVSFEVDEAKTSVKSLIKAPGKRLRVSLRQRAAERLAGAANEESAGGEYGDGGQQSWARNVEITGIVVLDDQRDRDQYSQTYFPWGKNGYLGRGGAKRRTLFVYGKNLPESFGDAVAIDTRSQYIAYPDYKLRPEIGAETERKAWEKAKVTDTDGLTAILVQATLQDEKILPGFKDLYVNGAGNVWHLDFPDANGFVTFAHEDEEDIMTPTSNLFTSDIGFIEVKLEAPFKFDTIDLALTHIHGPGWPQGKTPGDMSYPLTAKLAPDTQGLSFRTPPIHTYREDRRFYGPPPNAAALRLDVRPGDTFEARLTDKTRLLPLYNTVSITDPSRGVPTENKPPEKSTVAIVDKPADLGELWISALRRAAACHGDATNWTSRTVADEYSKRIFTEGFAKRSIPITIGDQAAAILIRDEFVKMTKEVIADYETIAATDASIERFRSASKSMRQRDPFWVVMQAKINGKEMPLGDTLDPAAKAAEWGITVERAYRAALEQTRAGLRTFIAQMNASVARANQAGDCNVLELMVIGGQRTQPVVARILPRLVKLADDSERQYWVPDTVARAYVKSLYVTGDAIKGLKEYAAIDEAYQAMALALLGGGIAAGLSRAGYAAGAAYAAIGFDAADMLYFGGKGVYDYWQNTKTTNFAQGAAGALGEDFYQEAKAAEGEWYWAALGVVAPGVGAGLGAKGLRQLGKVERGAAIAKRLGSWDPSLISRLDEADQAHLMEYLKDISAKQAKFGEQGRVGRFLDHTTKLGEEDAAFLNSYKAFARAQAEQVERGAQLARGLDNFDDAALARLTPEQRGDLGAFMNDVKQRQDVLAAAKADAPRIRGLSAWETEARAKFDAAGAGRAADTSPANVARNADVPPTATASNAANATPDAPPAGARPSAPGIDDPPYRGDGGLLDATPPPTRTASNAPDTPATGPRRPAETPAPSRPSSTRSADTETPPASPPARSASRGDETPPPPPSRSSSQPPPNQPTRAQPNPPRAANQPVSPEPAPAAPGPRAPGARPPAENPTGPARAADQPATAPARPARPADPPPPRNADAPSSTPPRAADQPASPTPTRTADQPASAPVRNAEPSPATPPRAADRPSATPARAAEAPAAPPTRTATNAADAPPTPARPRAGDTPPPASPPTRTATRTPDPAPQPAVSLRRSPEQVARQQEALGNVRRIERDGLQALSRMKPDEVRQFARAVDDARERFARLRSFDDMSPDEVRLMRLGDDLAREAIQFDDAARARVFNDVPPAKPIDPQAGARQLQTVADSVGRRLDRAEAGYQFARGARDPELRQAARRLKETADDLSFRQSVANKLLSDAADDPAKLAKVTERDLDWLSGRRARLSAEELAEAESTLARNGNRWTKVLKDKDLSPAALHRMTVHRRDLVNDMLDNIIADVEKSTGEKVNRLAFGSNNLTSDYDLSIKVQGGPGASEVVHRFNEDFKNLYHKESGTVFDTNVYTDPAYNYVPRRTAEGGVLDLSPRERDAYRQALFQDSKARRYMTDEQWDAHKAAKLDGATPDERRALEGLFSEVENNHRATQAWKDAELAKRVGGEDELRRLRASALDEDQARLKDLELEVYNRRYEELLDSVDRFGREQQRLANMDLSRGSAAVRDGVDPRMVRNPVNGGEALGGPNAYGKALDDIRASLDEAARLRASGNDAAALLKEAEADALRLEWAERLAGQTRSRQGQALHFASEAYQTDGTIAHVVGDLQAGGRKITVQSLRTPPVDPPLPREHYLNSLHENRADRFKELNAARDPQTGAFKDPAKAAAKAAKYTIRELDAAHQAGLRLADLPDQRLIDATVAVDRVRGNLDDVNKALRELGLDADSYVRMAEDASTRLLRQAQGASDLRRNAGDLARYMGETRASLALDEAAPGLNRAGVLDDAFRGAPPPPVAPPGRTPPRQVGTVVDPPDGLAPVFKQEDCRTCGAALGRTAIKRATGQDVAEDAIVGWSQRTGRGYNAADGGTWPSGMEDILNQAGVKTKAPFGRRFGRTGIKPEEGTGVARRLNDPGVRTVAPDPALDNLRFTVDDAARELRDGNQVLTVVDYARGRGVKDPTPHWVSIEKVGNGRIVKDGKVVVDGPYVVIGDPAVGKSVAMSQEDFARHWRPDGTVIALNPKNASSLPAPARATPPSLDDARTAARGLEPQAPGGRLRRPADQQGSPGLRETEERMARAISDGLVSERDIGELAAEYDKFFYATHVQGLPLSSQRVRAIGDRIARIKNSWPPAARDMFDARVPGALVNKETLLGGKIDDYIDPELGFSRTTPAHRAKVRSEQYRNPFAKGPEDRFLPPPSDVQADHILPVATIRNWPEFKALKDWEKQMEVIHNAENIIGLPSALNRSKSNLNVDEWNAYLQRTEGRSLSPEYVRWLRDEQDRLEELLRKQILCLSRTSRIESCR